MTIDILLRDLDGLHIVIRLEIVACSNMAPGVENKHPVIRHDTPHGG
jgi:hypothetical protein